MKEFVVRAYAKSELAMVYFPSAITPHAAVNMLMTWIKRDEKLMEKLRNLRYERNSKWFKPREVRAIVEHLGEP